MHLIKVAIFVRFRNVLINLVLKLKIGVGLSASKYMGYKEIPVTCISFILN